MTNKEVKFRITLTCFVDETVDIKLEGVSRRAEVLPLLRRCDKLVRLRLNRGEALGEKISKIESFSS